MRALKTGCFVLEWLNIYAVCYYFNYVFFYLRSSYGFGNKDNLLFAALNGFLYIFASWFGGKFAQRRGCYAALFVGFSTVAASLSCGLFATSPATHTMVMLGWTLGVCFTWPALEALAAESSSRAGLTRMVGMYNVVWASGAALAYFTGGALLEKLGPRSLFWLPASLHAAQLVLAWWLYGVAKRKAGSALAHDVMTESPPHPLPSDARLFLKMAWVANPFAYIAMNTVIPLVPDLAAKLDLSTASAGFVASVWLFARLGAFAVLWWWPGWHYRFGWLASAYVLMGASFAALLLASSLTVIVVSQLVFGSCVGLIYYSSLFYSMDVGETKGEHGGFHEALIGMGLCGGPAVGAATLYFFPGQRAAGIWAVTALLLAGLIILLWMRRRRAGSFD